MIRTITNLDDDGELSQFKTSVTFLNQEYEGIFIESYSPTGLTLTNGFYFHILIFKRYFFTMSNPYCSDISNGFNNLSRYSGDRSLCNFP